MFKNKSVISCDYQDIEKLICEHYNKKEFSLVANEELSNHTSREFEIDGDLDEDDLDDLKNFKNDGKYRHYITHILMNDLANKDILQKGEYVVDIFW